MSLLSDPFAYPYDVEWLLRKKRSIRRELLSQPHLQDRRVAILGGSTISEIKDILELFLLKDGIRPTFYESEYNRFYEDARFQNPELQAFHPEIIFIHTSSVNIPRFPAVRDSPEEIEALLDETMERFTSIWDQLAKDYGAPIIQNNFEMLRSRGLGNLDGYDVRGRGRFIEELNLRFGQEARKRSGLHLNDIHYLSAWVGLDRWHDRLAWFSYKYALSHEAIPFLADSVASLVRALSGRTRKALVLDLDNTLWGGVISEDGLQGIQIGRETPEAEAYTDFQEYVKRLQERGIVLAFCSKNDEVQALEGFNHPDSVLAVGDFAAFQANWQPKHENLQRIAKDLSLGIDSMVFADDNPMERHLVRTHEPSVAVPEMGSDIIRFVDIIDKSGLFEVVSISQEDMQRCAFYADNGARKGLEARFEDYGAFLASLEMVAEIRPFAPVYLDRICQLTNKSNQFNVTTRRCTLAEIEAMAGDPQWVTRYGRLKDKFGDNGLVSILAAHKEAGLLRIDLWLMSCRVLKRGMEEAIFDQLVEAAAECGATRIVGQYLPTAKNGMVKDLFQQMGFHLLERGPGGETSWGFDLPQKHVPRNKFIEVNK